MNLFSFLLKNEDIETCQLQNMSHVYKYKEKGETKNR